MSESINLFFYILSKYLGLLASVSFATTSILCYVLAVYIVFKVFNKLLGYIFDEGKNGGKGL